MADTQASRQQALADAAEVFGRAADIIERDGLYREDFWPASKNALYQPGMPCDVIAAIIVAQRPPTRRVHRGVVEAAVTGELYADAFTRLLFGGPRHLNHLARWADRSPADAVVAALRTAAATARTEGVRRG